VLLLLLKIPGVSNFSKGGDHKIKYFSGDVLEGIPLPKRFTFPFYYEPHQLTRIAATELQQYLEQQTELDHNFGLHADAEGMIIGKMFGVLVVQDAEGRIGYLSAFSGKLADSNDHPLFVPPVFDMLTEDSFFLKEQDVIDTINKEIEQLLTDGDYNSLKKSYEQLSASSSKQILACKLQLKKNKEQRGQLRMQQKEVLNEQDYSLFDAEMVKQSLYDKHQLKLLTETWKGKLDNISAELHKIDSRIQALKNERKERSAALQKQLFEQYVFLNKEGREKSLQEIFSQTSFGKPPAGAGECATPKLLQYAFVHGYKPLAMAEFWWGASPRSEIRKHQQFYPACTGKCKPILEHMLEGMELDENPFLLPADKELSLDIVYEDEYLIVVNKPSGLRSVPGVDIDDSVYSRLKTKLEGVEPLIVHRLDMGTSGLLVVAKTPQVHKHIQKQFLQRTVKKRYTALLLKPVNGEEGEITLPLQADVYNRPRQLVCQQTGKKSITRWKVVGRSGTMIKVHFWPLTGRTHQLRVHAAHELGLNSPIAGDDIYGTTAKRLYLHAAQLSFVHPITKERMSFEVGEDF
jgi:tRNA pseudouridine32 synthase/23S rRNA pseudouridine746 synthase